VLRQGLCPFEGGCFWMLSESLQKETSRLQDAAEIGRLSLLFGAGVSFPSGLPSWGGLLGLLAEKAGFDKQDKEQLSQLGFLDQPTLLKEAIGEQKFNQTVADIVNQGRYTPGHALLNMLHVPAITTNYDGLYENAAASCGEEIARLPWDAHKVCDGTNVRSVLKMHGCVTHPESIVLTRHDYMRYADERQALRGRVADLAMTTEILVVGFSMTDDNVHQILDTVRKVTYKDGKRDKGTMGTVVSLVENKMFRKQWDQDFTVLSCAASWGDEMNPAWLHDCFLSQLAERITVKRARSSFILNPMYECLLTEAEKKLAAALTEVVKLREDPHVRSSEAWGPVMQMLDNLGLPSRAREKLLNGMEGYSTPRQPVPDV